MGLKVGKSFVKTSLLKLSQVAAKKGCGGIKENKWTDVVWDEVIKVRGGESRISKNWER